MRISKLYYERPPTRSVHCTQTSRPSTLGRRTSNSSFTDALENNQQEYSAHLPAPSIWLKVSFPKERSSYPFFERSNPLVSTIICGPSFIPSERFFLIKHILQSFCTKSEVLNFETQFRVSVKLVWFSFVC